MEQSVFTNQQITDLPQHKSIVFEPLADKALLHAQLNWLLFFIPFCLVLAAVCYFNTDFAAMAQGYLLVAVPLLILLCMLYSCLLYTSPSPRDATLSRMPSSA